MLIPNLIWIYHVIVASERLLETAASCTDDPKLRQYFESHLKEERGHAQWLAEDLQSVDVDVKKTFPPAAVINMVGGIYYLIFHVSPLALLGYMQALESCAFTDLEKLENQYPASLLRTIRHHADHDPQHSEDLEAIIRTHPSELIGYVHTMTTRYLKSIPTQVVA